MDSGGPLCCGRAMSGIGVTRGDGVLLRSCSSCGRHAWMAGTHELTREELIDVLRDEPAPAPVAPPLEPRAARPASRPAVPKGPATAEDKRRELQDMLRGFTVHGNSS